MIWGQCLLRIIVVVKCLFLCMGQEIPKCLFRPPEHDVLFSAPGEALPDELANLDPRLIETICHEVVDQGHGVSWDDIAGQEGAKRLIQEIVVWPMLNPTLFQVTEVVGAIWAASKTVLD